MKKPSRRVCAFRCAAHAGSHLMAATGLHGALVAICLSAQLCGGQAIESDVSECEGSVKQGVLKLWVRTC